MRRLYGTLLFVAAAWFAFAAGSGQGSLFDWSPLRLLGSHYPYDAALLAAACWGIGLGVLLVLVPDLKEQSLPAHVPTTSRWAQNLRAQRGQSSPMATMFVLNVCLLVTMLFMAYIGAKTTSHFRMAAVFSLVAGLQIAAGLILLVLSLFEKPKGVQRLVWGGALYVAGTAVGVMIFVWGLPPVQA